MLISLIISIFIVFSNCFLTMKNQNEISLQEELERTRERLKETQAKLYARNKEIKRQKRQVVKYKVLNTGLRIALVKAELKKKLAEKIKAFKKFLSSITMTSESERK